MKRILVALIIMIAAILIAPAEEPGWIDNVYVTFTNGTYTWTCPHNTTLERIVLDPVYTNESTLTVDHYMESGAVTNIAIASNTVDNGWSYDSGDLEVHLENGDQLYIQSSYSAAGAANQTRAVIQCRGIKR